MAKKVKMVYGIKEIKIGGTRGRIVHNRGSKEYATSFAATMKKLYGDRFKYRVVKVPSLI